MRRNAWYWRRQARDRGSKGLRIVAEDGGRIVGYAIANADKEGAGIREVMWRPEHDGTDLGERLVLDLLRRVRRRKPLILSASAMPGSPLLPLIRDAVGHPQPSLGVFMARALDPSALLRDAVGVLRRRTDRSIRLRVDGRTASTRRGRPAATITLGADELLGLLLGARDLDQELRLGTVKLSPRTADAVAAAHAAFLKRRFWIADGW